MKPGFSLLELSITILLIGILYGFVSQIRLAKRSEAQMFLQNFSDYLALGLTESIRVDKPVKVNFLTSENKIIFSHETWKKVLKAPKNLNVDISSSSDEVSFFISPDGISGDIIVLKLDGLPALIYNPVTCMIDLK